MKNQVNDQANDQATSHELVDCPCCGREFDPKTANATFMEDLSPDVGLVYAMCPTCHHTFEKGAAAVKREMGNRCFLNFKSSLRKDAPSREWSVVGAIALPHQGDPAEGALRFGTYAPLTVIKALLWGELRLEDIWTDMKGRNWVDEMEVGHDNA